jgi:DNA polymerase III alpha subunit (gram-positive type)
MKILGFDVETTGLDATKDRVTEVGLVLFDSTMKQPVRVSGYLVKAPGGVSAEITKLTGITNDMLETYGVESRAGLSAVLAMAKTVDLIVAHNSPFDRGFLEAWCVREGMEAPKQPYADTRTDLPAEAYSHGKSASLKYLACDLGFTYPAHRAVNDVLAMLKILSMFDIDEFFKRSQIPNVTVRGVVSFDDKHLAKERGYHWKPEKKLWCKDMKLDLVDAEKEAAPFPVVLCEAQ